MSPQYIQSLFHHEDRNKYKKIVNK